MVYLKTFSVRRFFKRRKLLLFSNNRLQVTCKKGVVAYFVLLSRNLTGSTYETTGISGSVQPFF